MYPRSFNHSVRHPAIVNSKKMNSHFLMCNGVIRKRRLNSLAIYQLTPSCSLTSSICETIQHRVRYVHADHPTSLLLHLARSIISLVVVPAMLDKNDSTNVLGSQFDIPEPPSNLIALHIPCVPAMFWVTKLATYNNALQSSFLTEWKQVLRDLRCIPKLTVAGFPSDIDNQASDAVC